MAQSRMRRSRRKTVVGEQHPRNGPQTHLLLVFIHEILSFPRPSNRANHSLLLSSMYIGVRIYYTVMHLRPLLPTSNQRRGEVEETNNTEEEKPRARAKQRKEGGEGGILATAPGDQSLLSSFSSLSRLSCRLWRRRKEGGGE